MAVSIERSPDRPGSPPQHNTTTIGTELPSVGYIISGFCQTSAAPFPGRPSSDSQNYAAGIRIGPSCWVITSDSISGPSRDQSKKR